MKKIKGLPFQKGNRSFDKSVLQATLKEFFIANSMIVLGCALFGLGLNYFIKANNLATGGFSGIGLLLNYQLGWSIGVFFLLSNIPLVIISGILWGRRFVSRTVVGVAMSSFFADAFSFISFQEENLLLPAIYGGLLIGIGLGIVMRYGGTTGGTDILARLANQFTGVSIGSFLMGFNVLVLSAVALIYGLDIALYSLVNSYISSIALNRVINGLDSGKQAFIISDKHYEIAHFIMSELHRGCTVIPSQGGYSREGRQVIMCVVSRWQVFRLRKGTTKIDPNAFLIINDVYEIYGKGFRQS